MQASRVEWTVEIEPGETPDYQAEHTVKPIRPYEVEMVFVPPNKFHPDGQRFGNFTGWQVKKDGTAGAVSATHHTPLRTYDWPQWMTDLFDRYQPTWKDGV